MIYLILIAIIIVIGIKFVLPNIDKKEESYGAPIEIPAMKKEMEYPYAAKKLFTKTEYIFYKKLKEICDQREITIYPKIRMEDYIEVTNYKEKTKYRGYIKSRHIDFILANSKFEIIAGIELDDWTHNREDAKEKDSFKDKVFQKIGIPLYRIKVNTEYTNEIEKIINNLHYPANTENS